jgi:hypothetical protein
MRGGATDPYSSPISPKPTMPIIMRGERERVRGKQLITTRVNFQLILTPWVDLLFAGEICSDDS